MKSSSESAGFTLIELLVVIAIIGVLAAVVLLAINPAKMLMRSRDAQRKSDLIALHKAINLYMVQNAATYVPGYDTAFAAFGFTSLDQISNCIAGTSCCTVSDAAHAGWLAPTGGSCPTSDFPTWAVNLSGYLAKIPVDPLNSATYHYRYQTNDSSNDRYSLTAKLEVNNSPTNCYQTGTFLPVNVCWGP